MADTLTSLIATGEKASVNAFDYLVVLQRLLSLCTIAQAIRAVLLASATVATLTCFLARRRFGHWLSASSLLAQW